MKQHIGISHDTSFASYHLFPMLALLGPNRIWSAKNPHVFQQTSLHLQKVDVWCAILKYRVITPIFHKQTVNSEEHQCILSDFIALLYNTREERKVWLQQDNAKVHISDSLMIFIRKFFEERVISVGLWPPRRRDLSPADIFLWGFLKDVVYKNQLVFWNLWWICNLLSTHF